MIARRTVTVDELDMLELFTMKAAAKELLAGVGQLPSAVEAMGVGIHYRRAITDAELAHLSPAWCAIPAVHEAGRGFILEENT